MNICMVGTGYVGLVAGTCLSDFRMNVTCVDKDKSKIKMLGKTSCRSMGWGLRIYPPAGRKGKNLFVA
ncbi:MAG: hypothetical protein GY841_06320 [FCB group bacterium]|nr:hypothetical protein [FCB group bacterium]